VIGSAVLCYAFLSSALGCYSLLCFSSLCLLGFDLLCCALP
jgi:hypothetical protein